MRLYSSHFKKSIERRAEVTNKTPFTLFNRNIPWLCSEVSASFVNFPASYATAVNAAIICMQAPNWEKEEKIPAATLSHSRIRKGDDFLRNVSGWKFFSNVFLPWMIINSEAWRIIKKDKWVLFWSSVSFKQQKDMYVIVIQESHPSFSIAVRLLFYKRTFSNIVTCLVVVHLEYFLYNVWSEQIILNHWTAVCNLFVKLWRFFDCLLSSHPHSPTWFYFSTKNFICSSRNELPLFLAFLLFFQKGSDLYVCIIVVCSVPHK